MMVTAPALLHMNVIVHLTALVQGHSRPQIYAHGPMHVGQRSQMGVLVKSVLAASTVASHAVQEYVPFGNLFRNIHHPSASEKDVLQWYNKGRKVAIDVARGLVYLHGRKVS